MWSVWTVGAALALLLVARGELLRCQHPQCQYLGTVGGDPLYQVDGKTIEVKVQRGLFGNPGLLVDCYGGDVLHSAALPRAESTNYVLGVRVRRCPLPAGGSLADTLAALNVAYSDGSSSWMKTGQLFFGNMLPSLPLAARHLVGLENVLDLVISGENTMALERGFLAPLRNLKSLWVVDAELPDGELDAPPPALGMLTLNGTGVTRLPEGIRSLSTLRWIFIINQNALDAVAVPSGANDLFIESPATTLRLDTTRVLEKLMIGAWTEPRPARLASCNLLKQLSLSEPAMEALPAGWLANCSNLTSLEIIKARYLTSLPPQLFLNASALKRVSLTDGVLETVPADLLDYSPNVYMLNLARNRLRTLPSAMFVVSRRVTALSLSDNALDLESLRALSPLRGLTTLDLSGNPRLGPDVCPAAGHSSPLKNFVNLTNCL